MSCFHVLFDGTFKSIKTGFWTKLGWSSVLLPTGVQSNAISGSSPMILCLPQPHISVSLHRDFKRFQWSVISKYLGLVTTFSVLRFFFVVLSLTPGWLWLTSLSLSISLAFHSDTTHLQRCLFLSPNLCHYVYNPCKTLNKYLVPCQINAYRDGLLSPEHHSMPHV